jgi:hypothetical protein
VILLKGTDREPKADDATQSLKLRSVSAVVPQIDLV